MKQKLAENIKSFTTCLIDTACDQFRHSILLIFCIRFSFFILERWFSTLTWTLSGILVKCLQSSTTTMIARWSDWPWTALTEGQIHLLHHLILQSFHGIFPSTSQFGHRDIFCLAVPLLKDISCLIILFDTLSPPVLCDCLVMEEPNHKHSLQVLDS